MQGEQETPAPASRSFLPGDCVWIKDHRSGKWLQATALFRLGSLTYSVKCFNVVWHVHLDHMIAYESDLMLKQHTLPDVLLEQSLPLQPLTVNPEIIEEPRLQTDAGTDTGAQSPAQDCLPHSETDSPVTTSVPLRRSTRDRFKPKRLTEECDFHNTRSLP